MADRRTELRTLLAQAHEDILKVVDGLGPAQMEGATANPGWNGKDTLAHLATIEQRERAQVECALKRAAWAPGEDVDTFNARMVEERRSWPSDRIRAEFIQERD